MLILSLFHWQIFCSTFSGMCIFTRWSGNLTLSSSENFPDSFWSQSRYQTYQDDYNFSLNCSKWTEFYERHCPEIMFTWTLRIFKVKSVFRNIGIGSTVCNDSLYSRKSVSSRATWCKHFTNMSLEPSLLLESTPKGAYPLVWAASSLYFEVCFSFQSK